MDRSTADVLTTIAAHFALAAPIQAIIPLGQGLINDTYRLVCGNQDYVLQRISRTVFPNSGQVMDNLQTVITHCRAQVGRALQVPDLILTRDGATSLCDEADDRWRVTTFIPQTRTLARLADHHQARAVGVALGAFHRMLRTLSIDRLGIALPGFHDTPGYLKRLNAVLVGSTASGLDDCLAFIESRIDLIERLHRARAAGQIELQVTHGDPKLDNLLFDADSDRVVALIDLDTVQPGLVLHDIADCLRSCCNPKRSGTFDLELCGAILNGYATSSDAPLSAAEIELLDDAIRLLPLELGIRFLTDHLEGDRYFRISAPGQNLHKARVQFALVEDIERQRFALRTSIADAFGQIRAD